MSGRAFLVAAALTLCGCTYTGKIIDAHAHLEADRGPARIHPQVSGRPDVLLREMDRVGVERAVLLVVPPGVDLVAARDMHDQVAGLLKASPGRFIAIGSVQPPRVASAAARRKVRPLIRRP